jgi:hypothetical protein
MHLAKSQDDRDNYCIEGNLKVTVPPFACVDTTDDDAH